MPGRELHPTLTPAERRRLFARAVAEFDRGDYFAAHESWEEIWRSTDPEPRDLYQGLIQVAVGFHHYFERKRPDVARRVLAKGRRRLEGLPPETDSSGVDLPALLAQVRTWDAWLADPRSAEPGRPRLAGT